MLGLAATSNQSRSAQGQDSKAGRFGRGGDHRRKPDAMLMPRLLSTSFRSVRSIVAAAIKVAMAPRAVAGAQIVQDGVQVGEVDLAIIVGVADEAAVNVDEAGVLGGVESVQDVVGHGGQDDAVASTGKRSGVGEDLVVTEGTEPCGALRGDCKAAAVQDDVAPDCQEVVGAGW